MKHSSSGAKLSKGQAWFLAMVYEAPFNTSLVVDTAVLFYNISRADEFYSWTGRSLTEDCLYLINRRKK